MKPGHEGSSHRWWKPPSCFPQGLANAFEKVAKTNGIQVLGKEFTTDKASDFAAILTATKAKKPDAIFYGGYAPQGAPMARQMKQIGLNVKMLGKLLPLTKLLTLRSTVIRTERERGREGVKDYCSVRTEREGEGVENRGRERGR